MTNQAYFTGAGHKLNAHEWAIYRQAAYALFFYSGGKWEFDGQNRYFDGKLIHYSDFKKAERGEL